MSTCVDSYIEAQTHTCVTSLSLSPSISLSLAFSLFLYASLAFFSLCDTFVSKDSMITVVALLDTSHAYT